MRKLSVVIAAGAVAGAGLLAASGAKAADVIVGANGPLIEQVRTVCDEYGRCYQTRGGRRVIIEDSYGYAPRYRYEESYGYVPRDRYYGYRDYDRPRAGFGIEAPGVSVDVGVGSGY
ncbi:hypothetical protein V1291_004839 [Nitrobacteraceae bacterium AZCC 1564]